MEWVALQLLYQQLQLHPLPQQALVDTRQLQTLLLEHPINGVAMSDGDFEKAKTSVSNQHSKTNN